MFFAGFDSLSGKNCRGETQNEKNWINLRKIMYLKDKFKHELKRIVIVWECEYLKAKKENKFIQIHAQNFAAVNNKLILRETVRGGKVEAMLTWFKTESWGQKCELTSHDLNSLYPEVLVTKGLPCDKPMWIQGKDADLEMLENKFYYKRKRFYGALLVKIWVDPSKPLSTPLYPFLPLRHAGKAYCVLCRSCLMRKKQTACTHVSVEERAWTSNYTTVDLEYALCMGYRIVQIYEALAHFNLSYELKQHFEFLAGKNAVPRFP